MLMIKLQLLLQLLHKYFDTTGFNLGVIRLEGPEEGMLGDHMKEGMWG